MKTKLAVMCVLLLSASLWAVGCGMGSVVRPDDPTAGQAIGEDFVCTPEKLVGSLSPFTVDWSDGDRLALESEMQDGVALVKFTCEGVEVLRGCDVPGDYRYKGISKKTKLVTMNDMGSIKANIGGTVNLPSEFKAEMSQGSSLNLAYVLVGAQNTTVRNVSTANIQQPHCQGATHFVYEAQVGAFALETSAQGEVKAAADVLGYGSISGEAASKKKVRVTDGEPQACDSSSSKDREATEGCQALMRVSLIPLSSAAAQVDVKVEPVRGISLKTSDVRGCPEGFVYDDGQCKRVNVVKAYMCDVGDISGCQRQCEAGSVESCGRFSSALMDQTMGSSVFAQGENMETFFKYALPLRAQIVSACEQQEASACAVQALTLDLERARRDDTTGDPSREFVSEFVDLMDKACLLGDQRSCDMSAGVHGYSLFSGQGYKPSREKLDEVIGGACEGGNVNACWLIGEIYALHPDVGYSAIGRDMDKSLYYLSRACYGDNTTACAFAGIAYSGDDQCVSLMQAAVPFVLSKNGLASTSSSGGVDMDSVNDICAQTQRFNDPEKAADLFRAACDDPNRALAEVLCAFAP
jgi:uncharacterized protein